MTESLKTNIVLLVVMLAVVIAPVACAQQTPVTLNISAAASLTDVVKEINTAYVQAKPGVTITPNFGGSGTLRVQIENGAPVDIFISAAQDQMDMLQKKQLIIDDMRRNLLANKIVLVVPAAGSSTVTNFEDLAKQYVRKVAIGDPKSVPAGAYAQQVFQQLGITDAVKAKLVLGGDVRQVLTYVESGDVDAGVVYATDARGSNKVKVVAIAPDEINRKVIYPVAVIKASKVAPAAKEYEDFLFGSQAKAIFEKYGFTVLSQ
ncbi:MAG: molybdate ABC transporter substrate-binding protein [Dehalococcoidia bacterium]